MIVAASNGDSLIFSAVKYHIRFFVFSIFTILFSLVNSPIFELLKYSFFDRSCVEEVEGNIDQLEQKLDKVNII